MKEFKSYEEKQAYEDAKKREEDKRFFEEVKRHKQERERKLQRAEEEGVRMATPKRERIKSGLIKGVKGGIRGAKGVGTFLTALEEYTKPAAITRKRTKKRKTTKKRKRKAPSKRGGGSTMSFFEDW